MSLVPTRALVRFVPDSFPKCELTWIERDPPNVLLARRQHRAYVDALSASGLEIVSVEADEAYPDCVFVEDVVLDLGHLRVLCSSGAPSRRGERGPIAEVIGAHRAMPEGMRLDGGDVIRVRDALFVGRSTRSDAEAMAWLSEVSGLKVVPVALHNVLHLKTAATALDDDTLLAWPDAIDEEIFGSMTVVHTDGPNVLRLADRVLVRAGTATAGIVEARGYRACPLDISEFTRAEASLTCMSVLMGAED